MKPFLVSEANEQLRARYPSAESFALAAKALRNKDKAALLRLIVTEGIPAAFQNYPLLYDSLRDFLARRLEVHPKEITLIGSARLGYSLAPAPTFGRPMHSSSDLDLSVVSQKLFAQMSAIFETWQEDVNAGRKRPKNDKEKEYWPENLLRLPCNIRRGFIDPYKIPNIYPLPSSVSHALWLVREKLVVTPSAPQVKRVSLRVYRDWEAFIRQLFLNLERTLGSLEPEQVND